MSAAAAIGWLLIAAGAIAALPEIFTPLPTPGLIGFGLLLAVIGGVLICDSTDPKGGRDRGHGQ